MFYSIVVMVIGFFLNIIISINLTANTIDLPSAITRAFENHPSLKASESEIKIKAGEQYQAGRWQNPELDVDIDDAGTVGQGFGDNELTVAITQPFELGGKRLAREQAAGHSYTAALWEQESIKLKLYSEIYHAFVEVAYAQEELRLAEEQFRLSQDISSIFSDKENAGQIPLVQTNAAKISEAQAYLSLKQAKRKLASSKTKLALFWGLTCPDFEQVEFSFFEADCLPQLCSLQEKQCCHPDLEAWNARIFEAQNILTLERSRSIPDVNITAGYARSCGENKAIVGFSLPLPIFDRNDGNISAASARLYQLYHLRNQTRFELSTNLTDIYEKLCAAHENIMTLRDDIIPSATLAFNGAQEGYAHGKFDYLEFLDAQRTLFDMQAQYIEALKDYHQSKSALWSIVGCFTD